MAYTCTVHGPSVTGHQPIIKFKFSAAVSRSDTSVKVKLTNMKFWTSNGGYGYPMSLYAKVTGGSQVKLAKSTETHNAKWTIYPSDKTLTSPNNKTTTVKLSIGVYSSDKKHCYSKNPTWVKTYTFTAPAYDTTYIITYDSQGGVDGPTPQTFSVKSGIRISDIIPSKTVNVNYYIIPSQPSVPVTTVESMVFEDTSWNTNSSPNCTESVLRPGQEYDGTTVTANLTVTADWGAAPIVVQNPQIPLNITFVPGEGATVSPNPLTLYTNVEYYSLTSGGTAYCYPGATIYSSQDLDLYPKYIPLTVNKTDLPIPVKPGYTFEGWYTDPNFTEGTKITSSITIDHDITLYARYYKSSLWIKDEDGTWHRLFDPNDWERAPFVYKCVENNGQKEWQQVAQVYRCVQRDGQKYWEGF